MNALASWLAELAVRARRQAHQILYLEHCDKTVFASIRCGVLIVHAPWSGSSHRALWHLTAILARLDPDACLEFVIANTDGLPYPPTGSEFFDNRNGDGETAWIQSGSIVASASCWDCFDRKNHRRILVRGSDLDCFERNTRDLLSLEAEMPQE